MNRTEHIRNLAEALRRPPSGKIETLADGGAIQIKTLEGLVIEDFKTLGYTTQRVKFTDVNYMAKSPNPKAYHHCSFKVEVNRKIDAAVGPSHSFEVEERVMVDIYIETNEKYRVALPKNNPEVLRLIKNKDIFIAVDENDATLVFVLSKAVQTLFSEQAVENIVECNQKWAYIQVIPTQKNDVRHRGDLMFRELGLQVEFAPGSCGIFRGRELYHSTTLWEALSDHGRFCFVFTFGEAPRRLALKGVDDSTPANEPETCDFDEYHSDLEDTGSPKEGQGMEFLDHLRNFVEEERVEQALDEECENTMKRKREEDDAKDGGQKLRESPKKAYEYSVLKG
ncbi:hypothetical protein MMC18_001719 [Xylographa bjoerkii]|nr:hypothetical protein [Xylographa bjoerkii]